jgi:outer membrane protein
MEHAMAGGARFWTAAITGLFSLTPVKAADLVPPAEPVPPAAPLFFVHVGAFGEYFQINSQTVAGTGRIPPGFLLTNVAVPPIYGVALEAGYYVTPNITIAVSAGVPPPVGHFKATGFVGAGRLGTNELASARVGSIRLLLQYHFTQFGAFQPYIGAGGSYSLNFGNINDGLLTNFSLDQNFAFIVQGGADWMITPNWGLFIDGKKAFFSSDAQAFLLNTNIPVRAHIRFYPWIASTGITFRY